MTRRFPCTKFEAIRQLLPYAEGYRARRVTLYLTVLDEHDDEVHLDPKGEWVIYPYKSAADEHGA